MPKLSKEAIKTAIANGSVFAISIDTAVFDAKQKTFQNAVLRRLDQFYIRDIRVVFTDVVANEMKAHLRDDALETQRNLRKALRSHTIRWRRRESAREPEYLLLNSDAGTLAEAEFDTFVEHVNGEVIKTSDTPDVIDQILRRYFSKEPPFGPMDKRKNEFPDAFALLRLEAFAVEHGRLLLCVTPDKGWVAFATQSEYLVCVDKLEDALALFNEADQHLAETITRKWAESEGGEFLEVLANAFEYRLDDLNFNIEGSAVVPFEAEPLSAALQYISPHSIENPIVIDGDGETVTFAVHVEALVGFEASFNFYFEDSVDKDRVDLGSEEAYVEQNLSFDLTITADRSLEGCPIFHEVEVASNVLEVDFGYVEAFPNEDPTHEKY